MKKHKIGIRTLIAFIIMIVASNFYIIGSAIISSSRDLLYNHDYYGYFEKTDLGFKSICIGFILYVVLFAYVALISVDIRGF